MFGVELRSEVDLECPLYIKIHKGEKPYMAYKRLGDLLIAAGTITAEELDIGLQRQKETKERLGAALISAGIKDIYRQCLLFLPPGWQ